MDIAVQLFSKIPEGWPRVVVLLVILSIYAFPMFRGQVSRRERQRTELEHLRRVLELKKLIAELAVLRRSHDRDDLAGAEEARRLATLLRGKEVTGTAEEPALRFRARIQSAFAGSLLTAALIATVALFIGFKPPSLLRFVSREILSVVAGTVVAALIPAGRRRQSFVYGLLLPFAVGLLILLSHGPPVGEPR